MWWRIAAIPPGFANTPLGSELHVGTVAEPDTYPLDPDGGPGNTRPLPAHLTLKAKEGNLPGSPRPVGALAGRFAGRGVGVHALIRLPLATSWPRRVWTLTFAAAGSGGDWLIIKSPSRSEARVPGQYAMDGDCLVHEASGCPAARRPPHPVFGSPDLERETLAKRSRACQHLRRRGLRSRQRLVGESLHSARRRATSQRPSVERIHWPASRKRRRVASCRFQAPRTSATS